RGGGRRPVVAVEGGEAVAGDDPRSPALRYGAHRVGGRIGHQGDPPGGDAHRLLGDGGGAAGAGGAPEGDQVAVRHGRLGRRGRRGRRRRRCRGCGWTRRRRRGRGRAARDLREVGGAA